MPPRGEDVVRSVVIALGGPSASGKTATTRALSHRFGWVVVEEAYARLRPPPTLGFASQGKLVALELRLLEEETRRFREALSLAREGRPVVVDTPFLDPVGYTAGLYVLRRASPASLSAVLRRATSLAREGALGLPDLTIRLAVPLASRRRRAAVDPTGHPRAFRARHEAVGAVETRLLEPWWRRSLPGRTRRVQATGTVASVAARIDRLARDLQPLRDPCGAAARALEAMPRLPELRPAFAASGNLKRGTLSPRPPR